jgi:hypothetical protein
MQAYAIILCSTLLCAMLATTAGFAQPASLSARILHADARIRHQGNIRDDGAFSSWTDGVIGDWFEGRQSGRVTLGVTASGKTIDGVSPVMGVELIVPNAPTREIGRIGVASPGLQPYRLDIPVSQGFFGLRLRHLNRVADEKGEALRHLLLKEMVVQCAARSEWTLNGYAFFGSPSPPAKSGEKLQTLTTESLRVEVDAKNAVWSVANEKTGCRLDGVRPVFHIEGLAVDLAEYRAECVVDERPSHKLGAFKRLTLRYRKDGVLDVEYTLLAGDDEVIAQVDFTNNTGRELVVHRVAPAVASSVSLGGKAADWAILGDGRSNGEPCTLTRVGERREFECWWYVAAKNRATGRSVLVGNLTNNKGLGRFFVMPGADSSFRLAGYSDYEAIVMPPGARVVGEMTLLHFGQKGTDSLERFGDLIAKAHDIDLAKQHPLDPHTPEGLRLFTAWNSYGSAVVKGFDYKHDRAKFKAAYLDPEWCRANQKKLRDLGLHKFGYAPTGKVNVRGLPTPLVRRYGQPDFWFAEAKQISEAHPEYYVGGRIDFSNPAALEFERQRATRAFNQPPDAILHYGWDLTDRWEKLPGQHNTFMTSAETYRAATGLWRELGRRRTPGAYVLIWMNVVGLNYDRCDVIHIGHDSDQGYGGPGLTFTHGLTRQISGRYFYNGRVWWNSPDSFHVFCGGLYSLNQAKVHASFCAIAGNLVYLGEPFTDEEIPEDRLEILRRVSPTTPDVAQAVDVFENSPARLWNMPVRRPFGQWNIVGLFNVDFHRDGKPITHGIALEDLGLPPGREYLVYEFWSRQFLGVVKGKFTRTLQAPDCEVYSVVERKEHPVLISTSRHVRQMAYEVLALKWDAASLALSGTSKLVEGDPYQLRIFVPAGYTFAVAEAAGLPLSAKATGGLLAVDFLSPSNQEVEWKLRFTRAVQ